MYRLYSPKRRTDDGQGLAEYALILVLVAVATIVILVVLGPSTGDVYCQVVTILGGTCGSSDEGNEEEEEVDVVTVFKAECHQNHDGVLDLHVDARSNGDCDPSVTLTSSPGTVMTCVNHVYHHHYAVSICPTTVTVTSSAGGSATVTVTIKP